MNSLSRRRSRSRRSRSRNSRTARRARDRLRATLSTGRSLRSVPSRCGPCHCGQSAAYAKESAGQNCEREGGGRASGVAHRESLGNGGGVGVSTRRAAVRFDTRRHVSPAAFYRRAPPGGYRSLRGVGYTCADESPRRCRWIVQFAGHGRVRRPAAVGRARRNESWPMSCRRCRFWATTSWTRRVVGRAQVRSSDAVFDEAVLRLPEEWQSQVERLELSGVPGRKLARRPPKRRRRTDCRRFPRHGALRAVSIGQRQPGDRAFGAGAGAGREDDRRSGERKAGRHARTARSACWRPTTDRSSASGSRASLPSSAWPERTRGWVIDRRAADVRASTARLAAAGPARSRRAGDGRGLAKGIRPATRPGGRAT